MHSSTPPLIHSFGTRIAILGGGESGVGAALLAKAKGLAPFLSDSGELKPKYKQKLQENGIEFEEKYLL